MAYLIENVHGVEIPTTAFRGCGSGQWVDVATYGEQCAMQWADRPKLTVSQHCTMTALRASKGT
jgi:hypothetical protein